MRPEALVLYATNERKLYEKHKELARKKADLNKWTQHIIREILPAYRKKFREEHEGVSHDDLAITAIQLRDYYAEHIAGGA